MLTLTELMTGANANGMLPLQEEQLGSAVHQSLTALLRLSSDARVELTTVDLAKNLLHARGILSNLGPLEDIPANLLLLNDAGERHALLHLELPPGETFTELFGFGEEDTPNPMLAGHLESVDFEEGARGVFFSSLPDASSLTPYLSEYFPAANLDDTELRCGLNASLRIQIDRAFPAYAQSLFGADAGAVEEPLEALELLPAQTGQLYLSDAGTVNLRVNTPVEITDFGGENFTFSPFTLEMDLPLTGGKLFPLFRITGGARLNEKTYRFSGELNPYWHTLELRLDLANGASQLADWIGGDGALDSFPEPLLSLIAPDRLDVGVWISLTEKKIAGFDLVYAPATIEFLDGTLGLMPELTVTVDHPFTAARRELSWELNGEGYIGEGLRLAVAMTYPAPELSLQLVKPVAAGYLLKPFFGDVNVPGAAGLTLASLEMSYAPTANDFSLRAGITGDWGYDVGNFRMALSAIQLNARREAGLSSYGLAALIEIGGTPITLVGTHAQETGWNLRLETREAIVIDDWLFEISSGHFELPEGLSDFTISTLNFAYQTKTKAIALEVSSGNAFSIPLGNNNFIEVGGLRLTLNRDTRTMASLAGTTGFRLGSGGDFSFTVKMDYRSAEAALPFNSTTAPAAAPQKATWQFDARSDQPIDMADLIGWLGEKFGLSEDDQNLPDSVQGLSLTELYFTADTATRSYQFTGKSDFKLADLNGDIEIGIGIKRVKNEDGEEVNVTELKGVLFLEESDTGDVHQFDLVFNKSSGTIVNGVKVMLARYAGDLNLRKIVSLFAPDAAADIPAWLNPEMKDVMLVLVEKKSGGYNLYFSLNLNLTGEEGISLRELEFIGRFIPPGEESLTVSINLLYSGQKLESAAVRQYNRIVSKMGYTFRPDQRSLKKGFSIETVITAPLIGDDLVIPVTGDAAPAGEAAPSKTAWKPVRKKLGPVFIEKAGITMEDGKVKIILDGGMKMGPFEFNLLGFGIKIPLKTDLNPLTDIDFGLDGLELDVRKGEVNISGGFFRQIIPVNGRNYSGYAGQVRASIGPKSLTAFGGFVDIDGTPSFFLYAVALLPLGGVPEFFIDGFAGGFGLNSSLNIPPIEGVRNFIMVKAAFGESSFDEGGQGGGLSQIFEDIPPAIGQHWIALGIKANHYKFIESFILVAVTFGDRFELELLGLARLKMPKGAEKLVRAELAIHAHVIPAEGIIGIDARITDGSYVLNPMARLSGGFAFYTWFEGEHAGDFVITLGGYNSKFRKPDHYPAVPRLALSYQVTRNIYIKGSAYFALTPKLLMMGGRLEGTADLGIISAWFVVNADFTMNFQPFQYLIEASITIGATFTLDLWLVTIRKTIQIGADMKIWGPEFGGEATVDLAIVEFTIEFGKKRQAPAPISWDTFKRDLLPPEEELTRINVSKGVVRELKADKFGPDSVRYIVNPSELELVVESNIPAKTLEWAYLDKGNDPTVPDWKLGIGPMRVTKAEFQPRLKVVFSKPDDPEETGECDFEVIRGTVPAALWGGFMDRDINGPRLLGTGANDAPFKGMTLSPEKDKSADFTPPIKIKDLLTPVPTALTAPFPDYTPRPAAESMTEHNFKPLHEVLTAPDASLLNELSALDAFAYLPDQGVLSFNTSVTVTAADTTEFEDNPLLCTLGANAAGTLLTETIPA